MKVQRHISSYSYEKKGKTVNVTDHDRTYHLNNSVPHNNRNNSPINLDNYILHYHPTLYRGVNWDEFIYELKRKGKSDYSPFSVSFTDNFAVAKDFYEQKHSDEELKWTGAVIEIKENSLVDNNIIYIPDITKDDYINNPELIDHVWQEGEFSDGFVNDFPDYFYEQLKDFDNLLGKDLNNWGKYSKSSNKDKQEVIDIITEFRQWKKDEIENQGEIEFESDFIDYWDESAPRLMRIDKAHSIAITENEYITMNSPKMSKRNMIIHVKSPAQKEYIINKNPSLRNNIIINERL